MEKKIFLLNIFCALSVKAQVIIGGSVPSNQYTQLELQNTTDQKVLILPATSDKTTLPKYSSAEADEYNDDPSMEGMLMYDKNAKITKVYNGFKWENAFTPDYKATTWTRVKIENTKIKCLSVLCTRDTGLYLTVPLSLIKPEFADHLSILQSNSKFKMRQQGLYRFNFNLKFEGINLGLTSATVYIAIVVNGNTKGYMSADAAFISSASFLTSTDTVLFLGVNDIVSFEVSVDSGLSLADYTFGGTPESSVSVEKIL